MEHNSTASIEDEKMILCDADNSSSAEFNMPDVETMIEEISQPMDMEEEDSIYDTILVPLMRTLMDNDTTIVPQQVPLAEAASPQSSFNPPRKRYVHENQESHRDDTLRIKLSNCLIT